MDDLIIGRLESWLLTESQIALVRGRAKSWRVKREVGRRTTICRECSGQIPSKVARLSFKHLNWEAKIYDKVGYVHDDPKTCEKEKLAAEYLDWQGSQVAEYLEHPEDFEIYI